jgi:predicted O-linked N-acetylglucosamine transferase (SPINDLY family)
LDNIMAQTPIDGRPIPRGGLPLHSRDRLAKAQSLQLEGCIAEAELIFRETLRRHPGSFDAICALAQLACQLGRFADGVNLYRAAVQVDSNQADAFVNLGRALHHTGQGRAAVGSMELALSLNPHDDDARLEAAGWLVSASQTSTARDLLAPFLPVEQGVASSAYRAGRAAMVLGDRLSAISFFEEAAIALVADHATLLATGDELFGFSRFDSALAAYRRSHAIDKKSVASLLGLARTELRLGAMAEAVNHSDLAIQIDRSSTDAWNVRGCALIALRRFEEGAESLKQALRIQPNHVPSLSNFGKVLLALHKYEDAVTVFERLHQVAPDAPLVKGYLLHSKMLVCDWLRFDDLVSAIGRDIDRGITVAEPVDLQCFLADPVRLQRAARDYSAVHCPDSSNSRTRPTLSTGPRIRLGYVCGEFGHQATSSPIARLLELHDRDHFDIVFFDNGYDGRSQRNLMTPVVSDFVSIAAMRDEEAMAVVRSREIDVLVDLNKFSGNARRGLFARRAAPIQVSFLGCPGTLGVTYMDYLIADSVVVPREDLAFYDEAVIHLPDSYQPIDDRRPLARRRELRSDHGLPEQGVVFCNFSSSQEITPEVFAVWMRVLRGVPNSVLWLLARDDADAVEVNLRLAARDLGVDERRLVFAPVVNFDEHLERLPLADLVLDTLPYNANAVVSDALRAGVPILTCLGKSFAGRVGGSMLSAAALTGLITTSAFDYEALAIRLATDAFELGQWRRRFVEARSRAPLFQIDRYCRYVEAAYFEMVRRELLGLPKSHFSVPPLQADTTVISAVGIASVDRNSTVDEQG